MLPQLPDKVWTVVLGKLNAVRDFGRIQQVSRSFNAFIAEFCWININRVEYSCNYDEVETKVLLYDAKKQEMMSQEMPLEKQLLLGTELAKKATKITDVFMGFIVPESPIDDLMGPVLDRLAAGSQEIRSFRYHGDIVGLNQIFPSLARFIHANTKTLEKIQIQDYHEDDYGNRGLQVPPELLQALKECAQLKTAQLNFRSDVNGEFTLLDEPLFESIVTGKTQLKDFSLIVDDAPVAVLLDSGTHLEKFECFSPNLLRDYEEEMGRRGMAPTDQHPLLTVKELCMGMGCNPLFSMLPNLERLELCQADYYDLVAVISDFLTKHKGSPGSRKELTCRSIYGSGGNGWGLAEVVKKRVPCKADVKQPGNYEFEVAFFWGNASVICRQE